MRALALLLLVCILSAGVPAQHIVNMAGFSFIDTVSGTSTSTVALGTTVQWNVLGGIHMVTSGTGSADPNMGVLFSSGTLTSGSFSFTPAAPGTIDYFCVFHEGFGMFGQLVVLPGPAYPGSGEDLELGTGVGAAPTSGGGNDIKTAAAGDALNILSISPNGTFDGTTVLIVGALFTTGGSPPAAIAGFPEVHVGSSAVILIGGVPTLLGPPTLPSGGMNVSFTVPAGLGGQSLMLQTLTLSSAANNGFFPISDAHEIQF